MTDYGRGVALCLLAGAVSSTGGVLVRATGGAFCIGGFAVAARAGRGRDMLPTVALSAAIDVPVSLAAGAGSVAVGTRDLVLCAAMGVFQTTLGLLLFIAGARHLPAAETVLLGLVEVILAPLWVLLVFAEVPGWATVAGGTVVLAAVLGQGIAGARAARAVA